MYVHDMGSRDLKAESPFGPIRRIMSIATVIILSFFVVVLFGFGAKTGCTNDASLLRLSEQPCEAIDSWVWAGLFAASLLAVLGYGGLVPSRVSEVWLGMAVIGVLAVACIAMSQVTAVP